jgi:hypothetical protein
MADVVGRPYSAALPRRHWASFAFTAPTSTGSAPSVTAILIGASTLSSQKSVSASISDRRAPMQKSIASSTVDFPLSPAEIARQTGKPIPYKSLSEAEYAQALKGFGLPAFLAEALASWDVLIAKGAVFDDSRALSRLIGHPTTPLRPRSPPHWRNPRGPSAAERDFTDHGVAAGRSVHHRARRETR